MRGVLNVYQSKQIAKYMNEWNGFHLPVHFILKMLKKRERKTWGRMVVGELPGELFKQAGDSYIDVLALLFRQDGKVACTHRPDFKKNTQKFAFPLPMFWNTNYSWSAVQYIYAAEKKKMTRVIKADVVTKVLPFQNSSL